MQQFFQNGLVKQVELRLVAKEAGFIHRQVFYQRSQFGLSLMAGQQTVVAVERVEAASFEPALQTVLQKMRPALVKIHAAFLIDKGLQELQFRFSNLDLRASCSHESPLKCVLCAGPLCRGRGRLGLNNFSQPAQLAFLQNPCQVDQNNEPSRQFSYAGDIVQFAFLKNVGRRLDVTL